MGKPRSPERLERILAGILSVDNRPLLPRIALPTLVIGGEDDRLIGAQIQREMAQLIPTSRLKLYPGYGHGNDQENPDYAVQVERFAAQLYQ
jgi:pimeloyl-ACP methyl ester carboxylesterase